MSAAREPIAVIGTGYVGLVTAAGFAQLGNEVWCVDIDARKIAMLERGEVPIFEPGLEECLQRHRDRLHFSTELGPALEHARLLLVAVGTPPTYSGDADLTAVHQVVEAMPRSDRHAVVMKSTVPVGTGKAIRRNFTAAGKDGLAYVSCPEFLKEGSALQDFLHPDRVVVGDEGDWAGDAVVELYGPLGAPLVRTNIPTAEMIKLAANAFLATKISFINEIANVCEQTGADALEVARGMGMDHRIGQHFLKAGLGYGGSCFAPEETVLVRHRGRTTLVTFEQLWDRLARDHEELEEGLIEPHALDVLSWVPGSEQPQFMPVMCVTRRDYDGELIEVRTKMGRRMRTTPDHGWIVSDGHGGEPRFKLARDLTTTDWVPLALSRGEEWEGTKVASLMAAAQVLQVSGEQLVVRPRQEYIEQLLGSTTEEERRSLHGVASVNQPTDDNRMETVRLDELLDGQIPLPGAMLVDAADISSVPHAHVRVDQEFWRIAGLYLAEGCTCRDVIIWTFHPPHEQHLVHEVVEYWLRQGVRTRVRCTPTGRRVDISSGFLATWWTAILGMGRTSYDQRLPDMIWEQPDWAKWALLSGLFEGDGSWSLINGGPSVIIEFGTASDELADGVLRLLGDVGIVASQRMGRTSKSTKDTHWIRIAGADQIERAIDLVPKRDRPGVLDSIARQKKGIAPTGYRRFGDGPAWVRVTSLERKPSRSHVYSMEVSYSHTVVGSGGLSLSQCFPKDVSALKQLAGNTGYHFQLLTAVIEVNELQKRRVIAKLQKHLGSLVGKEVALLGLAFKAHTDDMREASSLVLSARLLADGARVRAYDPVAEKEARKLMSGVQFAPSSTDAIEGADACVIVTEWPEFAELDWEQVAGLMRGRVVIDGRNMLDPEAVRRAGLTYEGIGR